MRNITLERRAEQIRQKQFITGLSPQTPGSLGFAACPKPPWRMRDAIGLIGSRVAQAIFARATVTHYMRHL